MFSKRKSNHSPNAIYYFVSFLSPYFLLYVKCPKLRYWQLARSQDELKTIVDGSTERQVHPVLLFLSRNEAEEYAVGVLGLLPRRVFFNESGYFSFWHNVESFEAITLPVESIQIQKTLNVTPVVYAKEQITQMNSVHTLPFVDRQRS